MTSEFEQREMYTVVNSGLPFTVKGGTNIELIHVGT